MLSAESSHNLLITDDGAKKNSSSKSTWSRPGSSISVNGRPRDDTLMGVVQLYPARNVQIRVQVDVEVHVVVTYLQNCVHLLY